MDIADIVSEDPPTFDVDAPVSKVASVFDDPACEAVVVTDDDGIRGVLTRRELANSRHHPQEKVRSRVVSVPTVGPRADAREVARLMVGSGVGALPVVEDETVTGVITVDDVLRAVEPYLSVVTVSY
jgi:CBS domain-containing protein